MFADAEAYEQFMGRWSRLLATLLLDFAGISDGWHVLDVGSGTGSMSMEIASRRPQCRIVGVDPSNEYVAYSQARFRNDTVRFQVGDAQSLSFSDSTFDAGVSLLAFNFIPDPGRALAELRRVTRPAGRISAAVWDYDDGMQMLRIFWKSAAELEPTANQADERWMRLCRRNELTSLWKEGGLTRVEEEPLEIQMRFTSFDDFWQPFLKRQGPAGAFVHQLAPERQNALRDQVWRRLPKAAQHGGFELKGRAWAVKGTTPG
jgi:SAM-dependent methyltransferase